MSQENVDKSLAFIEAYNRRDFDAALRDFAPDIEWVLPAQQDSDSGVGHDAVLGFFRDIDEIMDELWLEVRETIDAGDRVAIRLRHHGRGKTSGIAIDEELYHQVSTFQDGVIVRMEYVDDWDGALRAAGVS